MPSARLCSPLSTFDGDHLLIKRDDLPTAITLLTAAGHLFTRAA